MLRVLVEQFFEGGSYLIELPLEALLAILCFRRARTRKSDVLSFYLLSGFFVCLTLCNLYYFLSWLVEADYPLVLSPGDLSWVGSILFLITAAQALAASWSPAQRASARRYRLPALLAPAVCLAFNGVYIAIYPEIIINYVLYGVPLLILAYYTLWLLLAARWGGVQPGLGVYHLAVLLWVIVQLFYDLFSTLGFDYGYAVPFTIFSWLLAFASVGIFFAARKGASA